MAPPGFQRTRPKMPLKGDQITVGHCYEMTIGGKPIIAKVLPIYPLEIGAASKLNG